MTEDQIKKGSTLLYQKKEMEDYLAKLGSPKINTEGITIYLNDFDEEMKIRWLSINRGFFGGEVERLRQELERL
jgi:hypothetical protein